MKAIDKKSKYPLPMKRVMKGFTLIELLVVVSIIALLVSILMPALSRARRQAKNTLCTANLKQIGLSMNIFAADHNDDYPGVTRAHWLHDLAYLISDYMLESGCDPKLFYCPLEPYKSWEKVHNWRKAEVGSLNHGYTLHNPPEPTDVEWRQNNYRVTSYFWLLAAEKHPDNYWEETYRPNGPDSMIRKRGKQFIDKMTVRQPAEKELVTDLVYCQNYPSGGVIDPSLNFDKMDWGQLYKVFGDYDSTSHMGRDGLPEGGNILFVDNHVSWRPFSEMEWRYTSRGVVGNPPYHWW